MSTCLYWFYVSQYKKNELFNKTIETEKPVVFEGTIKLIKALQRAGWKLGVASSSKNCRPILKTCGLLHYFGTIVDGVTSLEKGLKGKPEPDSVKISWTGKA